MASMRSASFKPRSFIPIGSFALVGGLVLGPDQLEVAPDGLAMTERDRLAVEHGFRHLAVLLVGLAIAARGALAAFRRVGRLHLGGAVARLARDLLDLTLRGQVGLLAIDISAD